MTENKLKVGDKFCCADGRKAVVTVAGPKAAKIEFMTATGVSVGSVSGSFAWLQDKLDTYGYKKV